MVPQIAVPGFAPTAATPRKSLRERIAEGIAGKNRKPIIQLKYEVTETDMNIVIPLDLLFSQMRERDEDVPDPQRPGEMKHVESAGLSFSLVPDGGATPHFRFLINDPNVKTNGYVTILPSKPILLNIPLDYSVARLATPADVAKMQGRDTYDPPAGHVTLSQTASE